MSARGLRRVFMWRTCAAKDLGGGHPVLVIPLREEIAGRTRTALTLLLWASAMLLVIACVNLTNLLLSRGAARRREVAVRTALGAGRGRLVRQFLTESLTLAALGALAGVALALPAILSNGSSPRRWATPLRSGSTGLS